METKDDLQIQNIQLNVIDPNSPDALLQLIEWAKQASAKQKEQQQEIDKLNRWVYPK